MPDKVEPALLEKIVDYLDGFYTDGPVDWEDALYRVEEAFHIDLGESMEDPTIKRIQRAVRKARKEARE